MDGGSSSIRCSGGSVMTDEPTAQISEGQQQIIKKIMYLKSLGKSNRAIAKILEEEKIPTKKGGNWNKTVVQSIIERQQKEEKCKQ